MRVMVVGSGGREHALLWKLAQSREISRLYALPGNGGTDPLAVRVEADPADPDAVAEAARSLRIDLVVVGPEAPLVAGVVDRLRGQGRPVFGPTARAARIEGSKIFAKTLMGEAGVPTARHEVVEDPEHLHSLARRLPRPWVVKADGLMAGKGVTVPQDLAEMERAALDLLSRGQRVLLEQPLQGREASLFVLTDGTEAVVLPPVRDHKRLLDGDRGPNTGGMGAVAPIPDFAGEAVRAAVDQTVHPILAALRRQGTPFTGCLFTGLMLTDDGPKVLEYNARFGDPEAQALLPLVVGDMFPALYRLATGSPPGEPPATEGAAVAVVVAAPGYPHRPELGAEIQGLRRLEDRDDVLVFHAGTVREGSRVYTAGGRVLCVVGRGRTLGEARERAYAAVSEISFPGMQYRRDIGASLA